MVDDKEESEIKIELIDDEDQHPNEIPPIKNSPNARAGSNMCRRSRISAIFSSSGEDPSYYEIQRGSISLQRNRQVFFVLSGIQLVLYCAQTSCAQLCLRHKGLTHKYAMSGEKVFLCVISCFISLFFTVQAGCAQVYKTGWRQFNAIFSVRRINLFVKIQECVTEN